MKKNIISKGFVIASICIAVFSSIIISTVFVPNFVSNHLSKIASSYVNQPHDNDKKQFYSFLENKLNIKLTQITDIEVIGDNCILTVSENPEFRQYYSDNVLKASVPTKASNEYFLEYFNSQYLILFQFGAFSVYQIIYGLGVLFFCTNTLDNTKCLIRKLIISVLAIIVSVLSVIILCYKLLDCWDNAFSAIRILSDSIIYVSCAVLIIDVVTNNKANNNCIDQDSRKSNEKAKEITMDLRTTFNKDEYNYDKTRPDYPSELFGEIFKYSSLSTNSNVLEIGIGTGQATFPFIQKGFNLTAVELGDRLAEYCKQKFSAYKSFSIINTDFLDADLPEKHFDLIFSATAFHWIPKDSGYAKIKSLLKSNGVLALFWNHPFVGNKEDETNLVSMAVYKKFRPNDKPPIQFDKSKCQVIINELAQFGFNDIQSKIYRRTRTLTSEEYINLIKTYSDHNALPEQLRLAFEQDMKQAIDEVGGKINIYDTIDLYLARIK